MSIKHPPSQQSNGHPSEAEVDEPSKKKHRIGVGTSVASLVKSESDDLVLVLTKIKVERLLPRGRQVIVSDTSEKLPAVFKRMVASNVLSLPVLNLKKKYYGMIDLSMLVEYITDLFSDFKSFKLIDLEKALNTEKKFLEASVRDVLRRPYHRGELFKPIHAGYSLYAAWETLAIGGLTRIPVIDDEGNIIDIITQSMLIDFLWQNIEKIGSLANIQIDDFKIAPSEALGTLRHDAKAIDAFKEMVAENRGGVAIVKSGKLVDNLSVRDLRGIHTDAAVFYRLWSHCIDYKDTIRKESPEKTPADLIFATQKDTLFSVVEKMATMHIHRIYVVDAASSLKPVRVITQTDILREILGK